MYLKYIIGLEQKFVAILFTCLHLAIIPFIEQSFNFRICFFNIVVREMIFKNYEQSMSKSAIFI